MKFIELFAGIGGFRYGLERVCIENEKQGLQGIGDTQGQGKQCIDGGSNKFTCVYTNEFNKYAASIYERHYEESINGNKNGRSQENTEGNKGQGFQPQKGEKVSAEKGQLSEHSNIWTKQREFSSVDTRDIREVRAEHIPDHELLTAGFPCQSFSVAGKRGGFEDTRGTLFFEIAGIAKQKQPRLLLLENVKGLLSHDKGKTFGTILNTLDELGYDLQWQVLNSKDFGVPQNRERVFIIGHLRGTSRPEVFPIQGVCEEDSNVATKGSGHEDRTWGGALRARGSKIFGSGDVFIKNETRVRRLTPTECERLQGFPDGWTEGISDTQRYKCLGNAVTTNVITAIGKKLI